MGGEPSWRYLQSGRGGWRNLACCSFMKHSQRKLQISGSATVIIIIYWICILPVIRRSQGGSQCEIQYKGKKDTIKTRTKPPHIYGLVHTSTCLVPREHGSELFSACPMTFPWKSCSLALDRRKPQSTENPIEISSNSVVKIQWVFPEESSRTRRSLDEAVDQWHSVVCWCPGGRALGRQDAEVEWNLPRQPSMCHQHHQPDASPELLCKARPCHISA